MITGSGRAAQIVGQGMKCLGWELPGRERCRQSPGLRLRLDKLDFVRGPRSLRSVLWSTAAAVPLPALADTSVPEAASARCRGG